MIRTNIIAKASMFLALTIVLAQVSIPIGAVPISLSLLGVYLTGLFLQPKYAFLTQIVYIMIGIIGLPVFSNFNSGFAVIIGPTGGYLLCYPIMSLIISLVKTKYNTNISIVLSMIIALLICYIVGTMQLSFLYKIEFAAAVKVAILPFIIGDILKIIIAFLIYNRTRYIL